MTDEFMKLVDSHLSRDGVLLANMIGSLVGDTSDLIWSMVVTTKNNIPYVDLYSTRDIPNSLVQNICVIASKEKVHMEEIELNLAFITSPRHTGYLDYRYEGEFPSNALILSDNFAPVEDMLNPITLTSYDRLGGLEFDNYFNPVFVALLWGITLGGLLIFSKKIKEKREKGSSFLPV
jgi:hypothetical protein